MMRALTALRSAEAAGSNCTKAEPIHWCHCGQQQQAQRGVFDENRTIAAHTDRLLRRFEKQRHHGQCEQQKRPVEHATKKIPSDWRNRLYKIGNHDDPGRGDEAKQLARRPADATSDKHWPPGRAIQARAYGRARCGTECRRCRRLGDASEIPAAY